MKGFTIFVLLIENILMSFADGLYLVFLDAQPQRDLDAPIQLQPTSTLLFVRLVALVGGSGISAYTSSDS